MKLFPLRRRAKQTRAKQIQKDLGEGLWRQAHDRYIRGLDRYHQIVEGVSDDAVYNQLVLIGNDLADQLPRVYAICREAHAKFPAVEMQVPAGASAIHSGLSRAANHLATTAEAAAMVRLQHGELEAVQHRAQQVLDCLTTAETAD